MQSFIVRIYRTAEKDTRRIVGVVEKAGEAGRQAFTRYDELWDILTEPKRPGSGMKKRSSLKAGSARR
jgi:hypothetical protein